MKYTQALNDLELQQRRKLAREAALRAMHERDGVDRISSGALIDKDQLVLEAQLLIDRAVAKAAAYGPGAILEALAQRP